jgi:hypothetical protein
MLGVLYGNKGPSCAVKQIAYDGQWPKGALAATVAAETLFPFSSVYNKKGMKPRKNPVDGGHGFLTCANNCANNQYCTLLMATKAFENVDLVHDCPDVSTCYPDRDMAHQITGTPTSADCCAGNSEQVGGVAGFPPGRWPSVFHGNHGGADGCTNDKFIAPMNQDKYKSLVSMWNDLLPQYQTTLPDQYDKGVGTFICLKEPGTGKEIKAVMAKGHGSLNGACGDAQLIRSKLGPNGEVTRYMALLQTAPRTWSLELTSPADVYIGGSSNDGSGGCLIPDAGVPLSGTTGWAQEWDESGKGVMSLRMYNGTKKACEDVQYVFAGPSPPAPPPTCTMDDGKEIKCDLVQSAPVACVVQLDDGRYNCEALNYGVCPGGTQPCKVA